MKFLFTDAAFSYEALRAVAYTPYDGADLGEVVATAATIEDGDLESWYSGWYGLAERTREIADRAREAGHAESARCAYLRASNYFRTAEFFLVAGQPDEPRQLRTYRRGVDCFRQALEQSTISWQPVRIPYEGTTLDGHYLRAGAGPRRTLLAHGGFDSTGEEMYFAAGAAALRRGWNCLLFEGPGQGAALRERGLVLRPDWEAVVTPVLDFAPTLPGVDPDRIALLGMSLGGLLAPRAAAFEDRLAGCIAFDGMHSAAEVVLDALTGVAGGADPLETLESALADLDAQPTSLRWLLSQAKWTLGASTAGEILERLRESDLSGVAQKITCPTLVCDAEADHFTAATAQPQKLHAELTCPKELMTFTAAEGSGEHCHMGAMTLFHQRAFDWLDETVPAQT